MPTAAPARAVTPGAGQAAEVVVFGSLNIDLVVRVPRAPEAGETLEGQSFMTNPGGKGANQAVACARQGARVALVGRVGDDEFGRTLVSALASDGIDTREVVTDTASTGVAMILVDDAAQNRIALVPGANAAVGKADAQRAAALLAGARVLALQLEVPMDAVCEAAAIARAAGVQVVLNPAPAQPLPASLWPLIDVLVLNEVEAVVLAGLQVSDLTGAARAAVALRSRGPSIVILTLGADGVVVASDEGCVHFAALKVDAVDTTAAGDTFIGAVCGAMARGEPVVAGVALGIRAAALCVTRPGAQSSVPRRDEVDAMPAVGLPVSIAPSP